MKLNVDGFTVEGDEDEILRLLVKMRNGTESVKVRQPQQELHGPGPLPRRNQKHLADPNSPYYLLSSRRRRNSPQMANTYDYIARYKNGRTVAQIAEFLGIKKTTVHARMASLLAEGLLLAPEHRGGAYKAVPREEIIT
jgi:hypothetical protein